MIKECDFVMELTLNDRLIIEEMLDQFYTQTEIAERIGKSQQCISKELKRYAYKGVYRAEHADFFAKQKKENKPVPNTKVSDNLIGLVIGYLKKGWSPKAICKKIKDVKVSFSTIYRWVAKGLIDKTLLARRGKKQRKKSTTKKHRFGTEENSIEQRPEVANNRERLGDWEADTIVCSQNSSCLLTLVCRKSRFLICKLLPNRKAKTIEKAICKLLKYQVKHTITFDNGSEFANWKNIEEKLDVKNYFCHPYCSWERGTNENTNGLLRRYFPKGTNFKKYRNRTIQQVVRLLNQRPREVLHYETPYEIYSNE